MAWAVVNSTFLANRTTAGTSLTSGAVTNTVEAGHAHIIGIALDNSGTGDGDNSEVTSVTDSAGNTYTKIGETTNGNGSAGAGATISAWYSIVTSQLTSGVHTVTANFSSRTAVAMFGWETTLTNPGIITLAGSLQTLANDAADPGSMSVSGLASREYLAIRLIASESNDITAMTVTGGFTTMNLSRANTGTSSTSMIVRGEYKIATATSFTSDPTLYSADHASLFFVLQEDSSTQTVSPSAHPLTATFPAPTINESVRPNALGLAATFPAASVRQVAKPGALALAATFAAAKASQGESPSALALVVTFPAATVIGTQFVAAAALSLPATFPTVKVNDRLLTAAFGISVSFPEPVIAQWIPAGAIALAPALPAAGIRQQGTAAALALTVTFPVVQVNGSVRPAAITLTVTASEPTVRVRVSPDVMALSVTIPAATVIGGGPPPPPDFSFVSPRTVTIRAYHGRSGDGLGRWEDLGTCEVVFEDYGPETARLTFPRNAPQVHRTRSAPDGVGVFVEIDGTEMGVPVWAGSFDTPQFDADGPDFGMALTGPRSWLDTIPVNGVAITSAPAAVLVRRAFAEARQPTWTHLGLQGAYVAPRMIEDSISAESLWALMTGFKERRGEYPYFEALRGQLGFRMSWRHGSSSSDFSSVVTLVHGQNCKLAPSAGSLRRPITELTGVANSYLAGSGYTGASVAAPAGVVVGMQQALGSSLASATSRGLLPGARTDVVPESPTASALRGELVTKMQRVMRPMLPAQVTDVDPALWRYLRPGRVVGARLQDPQGWFNNSLVRIRTCSWRLAPDLACNLSVELWALEAHRGD